MPTAYELEREANIARNRALLEQFELKEAVAALGIPAKQKPPPREKKAKPIQPAHRAKNVAAEPSRRQSARLKRSFVDPNESPAKRQKREQDDELARRKEEEERLAEEERAREAKKPRHHELDISTLADGEAWDARQLSSFMDLIQTLGSKRHTRRLPDQDAFVFEEDTKEEVEVAALRTRLQKLKVVARAKVTIDRVYSAAYHPEVTKDLIFFGDKHGQLGIWDARAPPGESDDADDDNEVPSADREGGKYWRLQPHWPATSKSSISCIKFDPFNCHTVYTSAYDCTVRSLSFETGLSSEVFSTDDLLINSIDVPPATHEMWLSDAAGGVTHLDLRQDKSKARWYQLSDQKIGCISANPQNPSFLLTASNSRLLRVWDARKLDGMPISGGSLDFDSEKIGSFLSSDSGKACQRAEFKHDKSVSSAYWDPSGRTIVSTSYDDTIRLWDVKPSSLSKGAPFSSFKPFGRIRHNCQTGKWLTILKAQWSQNPDVYPHFTIGNMDHSLDIFTCKGVPLVKLSDRSRITAVQAVSCSHPSVVERVATGNASGRCVLWAPPEDYE